MLSGLNHITLAVSNIEKSFDFYVNILGLKPHAKWNKGAHLSLGNLWLCLSFDKVHSRDDYTHFAFTISSYKFDEMKNILRKNNVKEWKLNKSEGKSIYFLDPDGHKIEIHVGTLESRLEAISQNPYEDLVVYN